MRVGAVARARLMVRGFYPGGKLGPVARVAENLLLTGALAAAGFFAWQRLKPPPPVPAAPTPSTLAAAPVAPREAATSLPAAVAQAPIEAIAEQAGIPETDIQAAQALTQRVNRHEPLFNADLRVAEELFGRFPEEPRLRDLLEATLVTLASQDRALRRFPEATAQLRRAIAVHPQSVAPREALAMVLLEASDWTGAESAAREALALAPRDPELLEALAYALFRQDRNREALEAFRAVLEVTDSPSAKGYLARLEKNARDEGGMTEQRLSHFHVRYDGEEHEDVGREILRALERHYSTLVATLDHQPSEAIAVILFSREGYYNASGAPRWSGGVFDHTDGRIRIPIGGLTTSLTPDIDEVLVHELTHAFINDRSRGLAPRELHEGLAQWMEGKRLESEYRGPELKALADGRAGGVGGFYALALAFVEHLQSLRGQGGINDLLLAMGELGDVDAAFRQVYGQDFRLTQQAAYERLRQKYGG
jgi:tetratricopeptide (TPR) repeat protein